jgi:hypothetical protein
MRLWQFVGHGRLALALALSTAALAVMARAIDDPKAPPAAANLPLVFQDDFERDSLKGWDFTDPAAWRSTRLDERHQRVLDQFRESKYQPPVRSPLNIALVQGQDLSDFVLDVQVRSTGRDYGHRDLCLFFGHQDPSHFYYVHLGKQADAAANSIFLVNGKPRYSIAEKRTEGTPWTNGWHHVRIVRTVKDGLIQVYFDDMKAPVMTAHDQTFTHGRVGLGSFDDTGMFDEIRIWGRKERSP